jgi:hypothetical protein
MTTLYRVHLFKGKDFIGIDKEYQAYTISNNLLSLGWGCVELKDCKNYEDYYKLASSYSEWDDAAFHKAINAIKWINKGDLCWAKVGGKYYLCKVDDDAPQYVYNPNFFRMGVSRKCTWKSYDMDEVPGKVINSLKYGSTLQRVISPVSLAYSKFLYDGTKTDGINSFADLLDSDDLEDLLGLYLQIEKNYLVFPSTNKKDTAEYEYMLINRDTTKLAVIQCKTGYDSIPTDSPLLSKSFINFDVYLTTIYGGYPANYGDNVHIVKIEILEEFAREHKNLIPRRIQKFIEFIGPSM